MAETLIVEDIMEALANLGGEADYGDIVTEVERERGGTDGYNDYEAFRSTIAAIISLHCPQSPKFDPAKALPLFKRTMRARYRLTNDPLTEESLKVLLGELRARRTGPIR